MTVAEIEVEEPVKEFKLTAKQHEAIEMISSEAMYILLYGGSRSTKTFTIMRTITWRALAVSDSRHVVLRYRFNHVKSSIVFDTFPKMMRLCFPQVVFKLNKEDYFVRFGNGSEIWFGGLDDKERTDKILGNEYATIFLNELSHGITYDSYLTLLTRLAQVCPYIDADGVEQILRLLFFADQNPPPRGHWSHKLFIEKIEPKTKQPLPNPEDYASLLMNPMDNLENLPASYIKILDNLPELKRNRFFLGKFADDSSNALWNDEVFAMNRVTAIPPEALPFVRIVVGVDPSGCSDDEDTNNDAIGIGVGALGRDGLGYCLEDLTLYGSPKQWGKVVADTYHRHKADRVVGESNYGGAMVEYVVKSNGQNISYKEVRASRGKTVRAEPISALQELGQIKMVGHFNELEDELCGFTTTGYMGAKSPNRADWFVWVFTELFPGKVEEKKRKPINVPRRKRF